MKKRFFSLLFLLSVVLPLSLSSQIPWRQKETFQFAQNIELQELISGFASLQGITAVIDDSVSGTVNGVFEDLSPEEFLNQVAQAYSLIWVYHNKVLYVYHSMKIQSKSFDISKLASERLLESISNFGIVSPSSSIVINEIGGVAYVSISGPPEYVRLVDEIAQRLNDNLKVSYLERPVVRIFPIKHAWAFDTTFTSRESTVVIPGVATVLRGLMDTGTAVKPSVVSGPEVKRNNFLSRKVETFNQEAGRREMDDETKPIVKEDLTVSSTNTLIQPDVRRNAIIVRDVEARMPEYQAIIETLDVPVDVVEISVAIVDINKNYSDTIGLNYASLTKGTDSIAANFTSASAGATTPAAGFNILGTGIIDGWSFVSQVEALASDGKAEVLSRPTVLTLDNVEATIANTQTFYQEIFGEKTTDLASVTAGTTLKVTPSIVKEEGVDPKIKLLINIEDGQIILAESGTTTPNTTNNTSLFTQAVIYEGQSLLIGGIFTENKAISETGIPILKDLPFIGMAFRKTVNTSTVNERMFLITPSIVNLDRYTPPREVRGRFDLPEYANESFKCPKPICQDDPCKRRKRCGIFSGRKHKYR